MATQRVLAVLLALALAQQPVRAQQPQDVYVIGYSDSTCRRKTSEIYAATSGGCWDYHPTTTGSAMADCALNRTWQYTSSDDCRGAATRTFAVGDCIPDPFGGYSRFECRRRDSSKCPPMYEWWLGIAPGSRAFEYSQGIGSDTNLLCLSKGTLFNDTLLDPVVKLGQDIGYVFQESKLPCKVFSNSFGIPVNASSGETTEGQCPLIDEPLKRCEYPEERLRGQDSWGGVSFKISMVNGKHTTEGSTPNVAIHPPYNRIFYNASHQMVFGSNGSSCVDERLGGTRYTSGVMLTRSPLTDMTYRSFMFANEAERLVALNDSRNEGLPYARKIVGSNGCDVEIVFEFKPNATGGLDVVMSQIPQTTFADPTTPGFTEERARIRELLAGNTSAYIDVDLQQVIVQVESAALRASQYLPVRDCDNGTTTTVKFSTQFICKATGDRVNITDIKFARSDGHHHALSTDPSNPTYFQLDRNNPSTCWNNITCLGRTWSPDFFLSIAGDAAPVSCGSFYWDPLLEAVPGDGSSATAFSTSTDVQIEVNTVSSRDFSSDAFDPTKNGAMLMLITLLAIFGAGVPLALLYDRKAAICAGPDGGEASSLRAKDHKFWSSLAEVSWMWKQEPRSWDVSKRAVVWRAKRSHPWLSVMLHPQGDYLGTLKRLVVLLTLLLSTAALCSLLAGTEQSLPFLTSDAALMVVAFVLSYPVPFVLDKLMDRDMPEAYEVRAAVGTQRRDVGECFSQCLCILTFVLQCEVEGDAGDADRLKTVKSVAAVVGKETMQQAANEITRNSPELSVPVIAAVVAADSTGKSSSAKVACSRTTPVAWDTVDTKGKGPDKPSNVDRQQNRLFNHEWSRNDVAAIAFGILASAGCAVLIAVLAYKHREDEERLGELSYFLFMQDFLARIAMILIVELVQHAPCICCA